MGDLGELRKDLETLGRCRVEALMGDRARFHADVVTNSMTDYVPAIQLHASAPKGDSDDWYELAEIFRLEDDLGIVRRRAEAWMVTDLHKMAHALRSDGTAAHGEPTDSP